jgi:hypothetical protein
VGKNMKKNMKKPGQKVWIYVHSSWRSHKWSFIVSCLREIAFNSRLEKLCLI